ncbi:MAG: nuclear transport factor 2 family protein [Sphingomonadales bacterium]|nr:nuclear transport factor 2 family protein [Sphingomonadales bacterium]
MPEDHYAIQRTINLYAQRTGRGDWDPVLALFTRDGAWAVPHLGVRFTGHDELRAGLGAMSHGMDYVLQHNAPAVIEVDGDSATARSNIREAGKFAGRDEGFEFFGIYADRLVRSGAGSGDGTGGVTWKFAERVFEHIGTHYFPLSPAPA